MIRALRRLGLPHDADERAIKRAYARLLREHRPDEDPVGFQALNEAYKTALTWARHRASTTPPPRREPVAMEDADSGEPGDPSVGQTAPAPTAPSASQPTELQREPPGGDLDMLGRPGMPGVAPEPPARTALTPDTPPSAPPTRPDRPPQVPPRHMPPPGDPAGIARDALRRPRAFDVQEFLNTLTGTGRQASALQLKRWLDSQEALYSIELKQRICEPLLFHLAARPPLRSAQLRVVLAFFGLDQIGTHHRHLIDLLHTVQAHARQAENGRPSAEPPPLPPPHHRGPPDNRRPASRGEGLPIPIVGIVGLCLLLARCVGAVVVG